LLLSIRKIAEPEAIPCTLSPEWLTSNTCTLINFILILSSKTVSSIFSENRRRQAPLCQLGKDMYFPWCKGSETTKKREKLNRYKYLYVFKILLLFSTNFPQF